MSSTGNGANTAGGSSNANASSFNQYTQSQGSNCPICLVSMPRRTDRTPCNHRFHGICLLTHLQDGNTTCPMCRTQLPDDYLTASGYAPRPNQIDRRLLNVQMDNDFVEDDLYQRCVLSQFIVRGGWASALPDLDDETPLEDWIRHAADFFHRVLIYTANEPGAALDMWFEDRVRFYDGERPFGHRFPVMHYPQLFRGRFWTDYLEWRELRLYEITGLTAEQRDYQTESEAEMTDGEDDGESADEEVSDADMTDINDEDDEDYVPT